MNKLDLALALEEAGHRELAIAVFREALRREREESGR